jgi:hypothetical protein
MLPVTPSAGRRIQVVGEPIGIAIRVLAATNPGYDFDSIMEFISMIIRMRKKPCTSSLPHCATDPPEAERCEKSLFSRPSTLTREY